MMANRTDVAEPVALITGGSAGLGLAIAKHFSTSGYRVLLVGRKLELLESAKAKLSTACQSSVQAYACDVTEPAQVEELFEFVKSEFKQLDVLVNCVGESDRGLIEDLAPDRLQKLIEVNLLSALLCTQKAIHLLEESQGVVLNIGSLASKVGARFIGGYAIAKHALAGLTQQMRLELKDRGVHVGLLSPGPIQRHDAGSRYSDQIDKELPDQAKQPGGGTRVGGLSPEYVASVAFGMVQKRQPDRVLPSYLRLLIGVGHLSPRLGDWLLMKFTSTKT